MRDSNQEPRDAKLLAAAVLVGIVLLAGIAMVGVRAFSNNDKNAPTRQSASSTAHSSSTCGLPDGKQTIPTTAPNAKWELSGKVAAPRSATFGPGKPGPAPSSCFAHNATGAVFAAANYLADSANPNVTRKRLITERIYNDANSHLAASDEGDPSARPTLQISGFRVEDSTRDRVSVAVVVRATEGPSAGQNYALTFTLGWQGGDWRIVVPSTGQPPTSAVASLSGYTPWAGA